MARSKIRSSGRQFSHDLGVAIAIALSSMCAVGCGESVEVTRLVSPADVARGEAGKLAPVAVVHDGMRTPIPAGAKIQPTEIVVDRGQGTFVYKLRANDVIETDDQGRIVAVRSGQMVTRFVPGTASSPDGSDEVRGVLAEPRTVIPLSPGDRIEVHGTLDADDKVPGGGHVESTRKTSMLVGGIVLTGLAFLPTAWVGVASSRPGDRVLLVPYAGPWIDYATRPKCVPPAGSQNLPVDPCIGETASRVGLLVSGIVQSFGGLLTLLAIPSHTYVDTTKDQARWTVVPTATPNGGGAAVVGSF